MKRTSLEISVPEPCDQSWSDMQPVSDGRYCDQCSRTLTDFSQMTDRELVNFFHNNDGKICGRFSRHQLNKPIPLQVPQPNRSIWNTVGLAFTGLMTSISGMAQNAQGVPAASMVAKGKASTGFVTVKGTVVDEKGEAIIFATVSVEGREIGTETDFDGHFSIEDELSMDDVLVVEYVGYQPVKVIVKEFLNEQNRKIVLKEAAVPLEEAHIVGYMVPAHLVNAVKQEKVLEGKVIDGETGEPLIGANILIKDTQIGVVGDFDGSFKLEIPEEFHKKDSITLQISYVGYASHEIVLKAAELPKRQLTVMMETYELAGEVVLLGEVAYNRATYPSTLVQWIKNLTYSAPYKRTHRKEKRRLRREERQARKLEETTNVENFESVENTPGQTVVYPWQAQAFPNPFTDQLQLELTVEKAMKIQVRLVDSGGQTLWSKNQLLDRGTQQWLLNPQDLPLTPGNYYWQIEGEDGQMQVLSLVYTARN